jgi:hypothetical protein
VEGGDDLAARIAPVLRRALGTQLARLEALPRQLGPRRFARVWTASGRPTTLIARVDAPEDPAGRPAGAAPEPPLEPLRALLERSGLPVPLRYGGDARAGVELLEDFGPTSLEAAVREAPPALRQALYAEACEWVARLQRVSPDEAGSVEAFRRRLDATLLAYKAELFVSFSLPARGREASAAEANAVREAFAQVAEEVRSAPARLSHRDYQSANLHVREGRPSGARLGLIDLQGAFLAPPEYDLVCLLRDSYVELPAQELAEQLARVRPRLPDAPEPGVFSRRFDLLTLTRKGKDHARFLQAARERGDPRYLRFVPAAVRALREAAARRAGDAPPFARLAELIFELPEAAPCAP